MGWPSPLSNEESYFNPTLIIQSNLLWVPSLTTYILQGARDITTNKTGPLLIFLCPLPLQKFLDLSVCLIQYINLPYPVYNLTQYINLFHLCGCCTVLRLLYCVLKMSAWYVLKHVRVILKCIKVTLFGQLSTYEYGLALIIRLEHYFRSHLSNVFFPIPFH